MHGIQAWVALPVEDEETDAGFRHHGAGATCPTYEGDGVWARLIAGEAFGAACAGADALADVLRRTGRLRGRRAAPMLRRDYPERAAYVASGTVEIEQPDASAPGRCSCFSRAGPVLVTAVGAAT